jgi:hypothetical protein
MPPYPSPPFAQPNRRSLACVRGQAGPGPGSFGSEAEYAAFLCPRLRPATRLVAVAGDRKGERGTFLQRNDSNNQPCLVQWDKPSEKGGSSSWVNWRDVALEVRALTKPPTHRHARQGCGTLRGRAQAPGT